jgi:Na+-transporting methylmalonyl-CoA/oxaloacetate decarboxylase gamma subunit
MSKFNRWQKITELVALAVIIFGGVCKMHHINGDAGVTVMLLFLSIMMYAILTCVAVFPATWRMTDKEKNKIPDLAKYQERYTSVFVVINVVVCLIMLALLWLLG